MSASGPFGAFRHPTFTVVWVATVVSNLGGWVSAAASGWLMTALDSDPFIVSLVQVATNLPLFVLALPAGALTDIVDRRRFLIVSELAVMGSCIILAVLVSRHLITPVSLLVMTGIVSAAGAIGAPAWQAVVSDLVPRADLPSAISVNGAGINVSRAAGPAIGGFLVSAFGYAPPFWIDAFSNAGVIGALLWWKGPPKRKAGIPSEGFASAIMLGIRHARYNAYLSATLIRAAAFFLFASSYWALLPVIARSYMSASPTLYGTLLGAIGAGAVTGAIVLPRIKERWGSNKLLAWCTAGTALTTLMFAVVTIPALSVIASLVAGLCWLGAVSTLTLSAQVALPEWVRGRGLAVFVTVMFGALSLGGLLWGAIAGLAGSQESLMVAAAGALVTIPLTARWQLQTGERVDFTPSLHWPAPITLHDVDGDRGPVLVTVEYKVNPKDRVRFLNALFRRSHERKRDGAYSWRVFEDPAADGRFVEAFLTESWQEHLRHHTRITNTDRLQEEAIRWCIKGEVPVTTHLIQIHRPE
jgi:MFS family permease